MLDAGLDQASGLRRLFARRMLRVLPVATDPLEPDSSQFVVNLAAALSRTGWNPIVIDGLRDGVAAQLGMDLPLELADLLEGHRSFASVAQHSTEGFCVLPAPRGLSQLARDPAAAEAVFGAIASLEESFDIALVSATGPTLGALLGRREAETALRCGPDDDDLTATYARLKSLVTAHGLSRFRVVFDHAATPAEIAHRHRRLAGAARRFLAAAVEYGGSIAPGDDQRLAARARASVFAVAAQGSAARAFERIASAARDWQLSAYEAAGAAIH